MPRVIIVEHIKSYNTLFINSIIPSYTHSFLIYYATCIHYQQDEIGCVFSVDTHANVLEKDIYSVYIDPTT